MSIEKNLNEWYFLLNQKRNGQYKLVRELTEDDISGKNITTTLQNDAPTIIGLIDGNPRPERFKKLKESITVLNDIGMYYSRVQGSGNLRLNKLHFRAAWGEEVAKGAIEGRNRGDLVGTGRDLLEKADNRLVEIIDFCNTHNIELDMDEFKSAFKNASDSSRGLRVAPVKRNIAAEDHPFLDRKYCIQSTVVAYGDSESDLESKLAEDENFKTVMGNVHHANEGVEHTIIKANNGARHSSAYSNFDLYAISKIDVMGRSELRTSVIELKKDNSTASIYKAITQAISYKSKKNSNHVWIMAPGFNEEQYAGTDFAAIRNQCMDHGIGILDIVLGNNGNDIEDVVKRLDAKRHPIEDFRTVNRILDEHGWACCAICRGYWIRGANEARTYCKSCRKEITALFEDRLKHRAQNTTRPDIADPANEATISNAVAEDGG